MPHCPTKHKEINTKQEITTTANLNQNSKSIYIIINQLCVVVHDKTWWDGDSNYDLFFWQLKLHT